MDRAIFLSRCLHARVRDIRLLRYVVCLPNFLNELMCICVPYSSPNPCRCTLEAKNFQRDVDKYQSLNTQIVGVSVDPVEKNAAFCSSQGLDFYMLSDQGGNVSKKYGSALTVPGFGSFSNRRTFIIDPKGELRWVFPDVESHIPRHSAEVLEKLGELTSA